MRSKHVIPIHHSAFHRSDPRRSRLIVIMNASAGVASPTGTLFVLPVSNCSATQQKTVGRAAMRSGRGRGRGRPPKNKQKPRLSPAQADERAFGVGSEVEVRSDVDGFRGSWFEATVVSRLDGGGGSYMVAYSTLIDDNGDKLEEVAAAADVRPRPPNPARQLSFAMYDVVDAFHNDGWWIGVVSGVPPSPELKYAVSFPTWREVMEFPASFLRPHLEFRHGNWVSAADARRPSRGVQHMSGKRTIYSILPTSNGNDEIRHEPGCYPNKKARKDVLLASGTKGGIRPQMSMLENRRLTYDCSFSMTRNLEVPRLPPSSTSLPSTAQTGLPKTLFGVFGQLRPLPHGPVFRKQSLQFGLSSMNRTKEPSIFEESDKSGDKSHDEANKEEHGIGDVDVQNELPDESPIGHVSCMDLALQENNQGSREYGVSGSCQLNREDDLPEPDDSATMGWPATEDNVLNENPRVMQLPSSTTLENVSDADMFSSDSRAQEDGNEASKAAITATLAFSKNLARKEHDSDGQFALHSKNAAKMGLEFDGPLSRRSLVVLEDVVVDLPSTENCEANMQDVLREDHGAAIVVCAAKGSLAAEEYHIQLSGRTPDEPVGAPTDALNSTEDYRACIQDDVSQDDHAAAIVDDLGGGCPPIENSSSTTQFFCDGTKKSIAEDSEITPISKNTISTEHAYDKPSLGEHSVVHESVSGDLHSEPVPNMDVPFVKSSSMWATIEAMDIFRKMPQQPHFLSLHHYDKRFREGMAFGLMVSFANLAESIWRLHVQDEKSLFEEMMRSLFYFEANGFDVKPLQSRLKMLLQIKNDQIGFKSTKEKLWETIFKKEVDSNLLDAQISNLEGANLELEQSASRFQREVESLLTQKKNDNSDISRLKKDAEEVEKSYLSSERRFNNVAAAPW